MPKATKKPKPMLGLAFTVEPEFYKRVKDAANIEQRSMANFIRLAVEVRVIQREQERDSA